MFNLFLYYQVVPKSLWGDRLFELIFYCVIKPADIGFNLGDVEIMNALPQEVSRWGEECLSQKHILVKLSFLYFENLPVSSFCYNFLKLVFTL